MWGFEGIGDSSGLSDELYPVCNCLQRCEVVLPPGGGVRLEIKVTNSLQTENGYFAILYTQSSCWETT